MTTIKVETKSWQYANRRIVQYIRTDKHGTSKYLEVQDLDPKSGKYLTSCTSHTKLTPSYLKKMLGIIPICKVSIFTL